MVIIFNVTKEECMFFNDLKYSNNKNNNNNNYNNNNNIVINYTALKCYLLQRQLFVPVALIWTPNHS